MKELKVKPDEELEYIVSRSCHELLNIIIILYVLMKKKGANIHQGESREAEVRHIFFSRAYHHHIGTTGIFQR